MRLFGLNKIIHGLPLLALIFLTSCGTGFGPQGAIVFHRIGVYGDVVEGDKYGESCARSILGLVAYGDASVDAAATPAGIRKINTINLDSFSLFGVYSSLCTVVRGD